MHALLCRLRVLVLASVAIMFFTSQASADVVSAPTVTVKRFTGILSSSGPVAQSPGQPLSPTAKWVDFICDPRSIDWKIQVLNLGPFLPTLYINNPRICDHVEILMLYYNPQVSFPDTGPVDGTAIYIMRIP